MVPQAFSSKQGSTLHLVIPALEALYKAWSLHSERSKYVQFAPVLKDAAAKVDEYYEKTTHSAAYVLSMCTFIFSMNGLHESDFCTSVLNPTGKMAYFKKHWP
jgi:hypothetical protein